MQPIMQLIGSSDAGGSDLNILGTLGGLAQNSIMHKLNSEFPHDPRRG